MFQNIHLGKKIYRTTTIQNVENIILHLNKINIIIEYIFKLLNTMLII